MNTTSLNQKEIPIRGFTNVGGGAYNTGMTNTTHHSLSRIHERLNDAGISDHNIATLARIVDSVAGTINGSVAIRLLDLGKQVNEAWGDRSNGNLVYAIVRNRHVVTTFLRRSTQTNTTEALRVDRIVALEDLV